MMTADEFYDELNPIDSSKVGIIKRAAEFAKDNAIKFAEAYAENRLSEQWKSYPENQPVKDGDYLCWWSHYRTLPETAELKNGVWYGGEYGLRLEEPTHFMEIPKLPI